MIGEATTYDEKEMLLILSLIHKNLLFKKNNGRILVILYK